MKSAAGVFLFTLLACPVLNGQPERGTLCVTTNSPEPRRIISPGGAYNPATLSIKIDKRKPILCPHKQSAKIGELDLRERHLVVLTSDGKRIQSFWFRFSDYRTSDLCISFDGYEGVQLQDKKSSPRCKCK